MKSKHRSLLSTHFRISTLSSIIALINTARQQKASSS
jgi:hypothetical protein